MVTEEEVSALLQIHGWYLDMVPKYRTRYGYAKRREGKQVKTRYLGTERKFPQLTAEEVLKRINK